MGGNAEHRAGPYHAGQTSQGCVATKKIEKRNAKGMSMARGSLSGRCLLERRASSVEHPPWRPDQPVCSQHMVSKVRLRRAPAGRL